MTYVLWSSFLFIPLCYVFLQIFTLLTFWNYINLSLFRWYSSRGSWTCKGTSLYFTLEPQGISNRTSLYSSDCNCKSGAHQDHLWYFCLGLVKFSCALDFKFTGVLSLIVLWWAMLEIPTWTSAVFVGGGRGRGIGDHCCSKGGAGRAGCVGVNCRGCYREYSVEFNMVFTSSNKKFS